MKETIIYLNTANGQSSFQTEIIQGRLDSVIVYSGEKVEVIIESEYGYLILHRPEHYGMKYYAPRARTTTAIEDLMDRPSFEQFNLNESLFITVRGRKNEIVRFVLRVD